jgi:hypothetical protein
VRRLRQHLRGSGYRIVTVVGVGAYEIMADAPAERVLVSPGGRYDDQVYALLPFLEWFAQNERYLPADYLLLTNIVRRGAAQRWDAPAYDDRSMRS